MPYGVIYTRTNKVNGKVYVGQTIRSEEVRWKQHVYYATKKGSSFPIHEAIRKYGVDSFIGKIVCECSTQGELDEKEKEFCDLLKAWSPTGYSLRAGQGRGTFSLESREKMSQAALGRIRSEEAKRKTSDSLMGHSVSEEARQKIGSNNAKKTYYFLSPLGEAVTATNLQKFCRDNNLYAGCMCLVASGKQRCHKGWTRDDSHYINS